jgi:cerevisin
MGYAGHFHEDVIEQVRRHPDVSSLPFPSRASRGRRLMNPLLSTGRIHREGLRGPYHERWLSREERPLGSRPYLSP